MKQWLTGVFIRVYSKAVYCQACGYEIGCNPECAECRTMKASPAALRRSNLVDKQRVQSQYKSPRKS